MNLRYRAAVILLVWTTQGTSRAQAPDDAPRTALEVKATGSKTLYVDGRSGNNQVTFFSESTLEDFTGVCNKVGGQCQVDPRRLESFSERISLRVEDLDTGIDLRNEHLAGPDWLNAAEYPEIVVQVARAEQVKRTAPNSAEMMLVGTVTMHGVTKDVRIACRLSYLDESPATMRRVKGDLIRLRASFDVTLTDFGITGPPGSDTIGLKVAETITLKVNVFGSTEPPPPPLEADALTDTPRRLPPPKRPSSQPSG